AVLAITITNRRTRMPACGPSYWWAKGINYEFPDPAGPGRNGSLTLWNVLRFDGRYRLHRRPPGAERRMQPGTKRRRGRQTPAARRPCVLTPSSPEPTASKGERDHLRGRLVKQEAIDASSALSALQACPACGSAPPHMHRFTVNGCAIWQCQICGLGRAQTEGFEPSAYYTAGYFSGDRSDGYADYLGAEPVLRREFARSVDFIRRYRSGGKLLELGCAYGFFLKAAARYFDVAGIELAPEAAAHGQREGLNVLQGTADAANLQRIGKVDVIVLFDV